MSKSYDYKNWSSKDQQVAQLKAFAKKIDPTPKDGVLTESDIKNLSYEQKRDFYLLATGLDRGLLASGAPKINPVFNACDFFDSQPIKYNIDIHKSFRDKLSAAAQETLFVKIEKAMRLILRDAAKSPDFKNMSEASCWPKRLANNEIEIVAVDDVKKYIAEFDDSGKSLAEMSTRKDVSAFTGFFTDEHGDQIVRIVLDFTVIKNTEALYGALAHELVGHVALSLSDHPVAHDENYCPDENMAFERSVAFLHSAVLLTTRNESDHNLSELYQDLVFQEFCLATFKDCVKKQGK